MNSDDSGTSGVVIFGASYAKNWNPQALAGYKTINKGVAGNETTDMLARYYEDVIKQKPKKVIIWGFINDIFRSDSTNLEYRLSRIKKNISEMVSLAKKNAITPVIATEVTITSPSSWKEIIFGFVGKLRGKQSYAEHINKYVMSTNDWLRKYAAEQKILLLDFEKILSDGDGERKRKYAIEDGSHLSAEAYEALTAYVSGVNIEI